MATFKPVVFKKNSFEEMVLTKRFHVSYFNSKYFVMKTCSMTSVLLHHNTIMRYFESALYDCCSTVTIRKKMAVYTHGLWWTKKLLSAKISRTTLKLAKKLTSQFVCIRDHQFDWENSGTRKTRGQLFPLFSDHKNIYFFLIL